MAETISGQIEVHLDLLFLTDGVKPSEVANVVEAAIRSILQTCPVSKGASASIAKMTLKQTRTIAVGTFNSNTSGFGGAFDI